MGIKAVTAQKKASGRSHAKATNKTKATCHARVSMTIPSTLLYCHIYGT